MDATQKIALQATLARWKTPFHYNAEGQFIADSEGNRILDCRGWGYLTGRGSGALGLSDAKAEQIILEVGVGVAQLLNGG